MILNVWQRLDGIPEWVGREFDFQEHGFARCRLLATCRWQRITLLPLAIYVHSLADSDELAVGEHGQAVLLAIAMFRALGHYAVVHHIDIFRYSDAESHLLTAFSGDSDILLIV